MRTNHLFTSTLAATVLLFASCATQQLASSTTDDDVYNTTAQARVYKYSPPAQVAQLDTNRYNTDYARSNPNYDMDYSSRIDRFYYGNSRPYFDDYYNFYGYNSWYNPYHVSLGFGMNWGYNRWYTFDRWNPYYGQYYGNGWGPYSYYDRFGGGYYGGGYYGNGYGNGYYGGTNVIVRNNENYGPRPTRTDESRSGRYNGGVAPSRGNVNNTDIGRPTRVEGYNPTTNGTVSRPTTTQSANPTGSRPSRATQTAPPSTGETTPARPTYTPPPTTSNTPPPTNTGSSSSGSSSGGSSSGSRPTRSGGNG